MFSAHFVDFVRNGYESVVGESIIGRERGNNDVDSASARYSELNM